MAKTSDSRRTPRGKSKLADNLKGASGTTRDLGPSGILFETDRSLSPGQPARFTITLEYGHPDGPMRMTCEGEVAGVEQRGDKIGVISTIESYSFGELRPKTEKTEIDRRCR